MKLIKSLVISALLSMIAMSIYSIAIEDTSCGNMHTEADLATTALLHRILYPDTVFHK